MEEEYEFYIFSAEKLANFCKNELEAIASVQELNYKLGLFGVDCDKLKETLEKVKLTMPETVVVLRRGFFKEGQLEEIAGRFGDYLYQIEKSLGKINEIGTIAANETLCFRESLETLFKNEKPKKSSTHNKYKKIEFHRRFF